MQPQQQQQPWRIEWGVVPPPWAQVTLVPLPVPVQARVMGPRLVLAPVWIWVLWAL